MSFSSKPSVQLSRVPHGGLDFAELSRLGLTPEAIVDFSVNTNPYGPPPGLWEALHQVPLERYPDAEALELRGCLGGHLGLNPEQITVGNGSLELIRLAALAYLAPGDVALVLEPTFGEYAAACKMARAEVCSLTAQEEEGFQPRLTEIFAAIRHHRPRALFLCNPNNPTGVVLLPEAIENLAEEMGDGILVIDEAYRAFTCQPLPSLGILERGNVLLLRSMTKDYALAGLRLGYALGSPAVSAALEALRPPWNVNTLAQQAGVFALRCQGFLDDSLEAIATNKAYLVRDLEGLGLRCLPSDTHFFLVAVGDAAAFRHALLARGFLVRDCASFGLPHFVRLAPRKLPECQRLIEAVKEVLSLDPLLAGPTWRDRVE